jgi:hypothetical protein
LTLPKADNKKRKTLPDVELMDDLTEIEMAAGTPEPLAVESARASESMINEAMKTCLTHPLPASKKASEIEHDLNALLDSIENPFSESGDAGEGKTD